MEMTRELYNRQLYQETYVIFNKSVHNIYSIVLFVSEKMSIFRIKYLR